MSKMIKKKQFAILVFVSYGTEIGLNLSCLGV